MVRWDGHGRRFWLGDPVDAALQLALVAFDVQPSTAPSRIAAALAVGLAGCDFPPTGVRADPDTVAATLRAHRILDRPAGA